MAAFAYHNNVHLSIDRVFYILFKNYVVDFVNEFESRFIKKNSLLLKKQSDCKVAKSPCENCKKIL